MEALAVAVILVQVVAGVAGLFFLVTEAVVATGGALTPEAVGAYMLFHRTTALGLTLGWFLVIELVVWGLGYAALDALSEWATNEEKILWPLTFPLVVIDELRIRQELKKHRKVSGLPRGGLSVVLVILGLLITAILLARAFGIVK